MDTLPRDARIRRALCRQRLAALAALAFHPPSAAEAPPLDAGVRAWLTDLEARVPPTSSRPHFRHPPFLADFQDVSLALQSLFDDVVDGKTLRATLPLAITVTSTETAVRVELASAAGAFSAAVLWAAITYLEHVPRSLLRRCAAPGCRRPFVAAKRGRYCALHATAAAATARQRAAEQAFRARAKAQRSTQRSKR